MVLVSESERINLLAAGENRAVFGTCAENRAHNGIGYFTGSRQVDGEIGVGGCTEANGSSYEALRL
jgi:hypothetical protein